MKICFCTFIFISWLSSWSYATDAVETPQKKSVIFGHNVTPTTQVLAKNDFTVGNYVLGWGATSELTLATSPWIWIDYNTPNFHVKWARKISEEEKGGLFFSYFHSDRNIKIRTWTDFPYQWQSASLHALYSYETTTKKIFNFNLHYAYFWNDDAPYSIRMDPGSIDIPSQVDLTSLTQLPLPWQDTFVLLEFGGLGLNYVYPYMQTGASFVYQTSQWLLQFGYSYTMMFADIGSGKPLESIRWQEPRWRYDRSDGVLSSYRWYEASAHPEIHIQYFF